MIWKTKTHRFSATICQHTGKTCPALARLARSMVDALDQAGPATTSDFEIEGSSDLTHCSDGCHARFRASQSRVRVYCGADPDTDSETLDRYADLMFGTDASGLPSAAMTSLPCAMLEASVIAPRKTAPAELQLSA